MPTALLLLPIPPLCGASRTPASLCPLCSIVSLLNSTRVTRDSARRGNSAVRFFPNLAAFFIEPGFSRHYTGANCQVPPEVRQTGRAVGLYGRTI